MAAMKQKKQEPADDDLATAIEAGRYLGVSSRTILRMMDDGKLDDIRASDRSRRTTWGSLRRRRQPIQKSAQTKKAEA